jgi:SAM-dependent methyltransferase
MDRQVYEHLRRLEDRHWWFLARRSILADQISRLGLPRSARLLEVGCGAGGNLELLARFGEVTAVEPDEESRSFAAGKAHATVVDGGLPDGLPFPSERFDLVAALDVIEHIDDDGASVRALAGLLKPGGFLVATVPAYRWMWSAHDALHHHKRRYTLGRFRRLFETAGLKVRKASYFNTLLFPLIAAIRLVKAALGMKRGDEEAMPGASLNSILSALFGAERFWLRTAAFPFGVSILLIAERTADGRAHGG